MTNCSLDQKWIQKFYINYLSTDVHVILQVAIYASLPGNSITELKNKKFSDSINKQFCHAGT